MSNGKAADDDARGEGQAFVVKIFVLKKLYIKILHNKQVKAYILGGRLLWAAQKAGFLFLL